MSIRFEPRAATTADLEKSVKVTVEGPVGVGKTSIALLIAHTLQSQGFHVALQSDEIYAGESLQMLGNILTGRPELRETFVEVHDHVANGEVA